MMQRRLSIEESLALVERVSDPKTQSVYCENINVPFTVYLGSATGFAVEPHATKTTLIVRTVL